MLPALHSLSSCFTFKLILAFTTIYLIHVIVIIIQTSRVHQASNLLIVVNILTITIVVHRSLGIINVRLRIQVGPETVHPLTGEHTENSSLVLREFYAQISIVNRVQEQWRDHTWWRFSAEGDQIFSKVKSLDPCQTKMRELRAFVEQCVDSLDE